MLLAMTLGVGAGHAQAPCRLQQIGEFPLLANSGDLTVAATIDGKPVEMVIDTGSPVSLLFRKSAERLGLKPNIKSDIQMFGVGGGDTVSEVKIAEMTIGSQTGRNLNLAVSGFTDDRRIGGLIGLDVLLRSDVEFDVAGGRVRFFKPQGCAGGQVVYWAKPYAVAPFERTGRSKTIVVPVTLGGASVRAGMDSGSSASIVTPVTMRRAGLTPAQTTPVQKSFGLGKESVDTAVAVFASFGFGQETIKNAKLRVADLFKADVEVSLGSMLPQPTIDAPQMLLGADFFRSHRIYISLGQAKVYASYIGGPVFDSGAPRPAAPAPKP